MRGMWALCAAVLIAAGCGGGSGGNNKNRNTGGTDSDPGTSVDGLVTVEFSQTSDADGLLVVEIEVAEGTTSFMITGESGRYVALEWLKNPAGDKVIRWQDWWDSAESVSNAFFGFDKVTAFNWPIRDEDGTLAPGLWTAQLATMSRGGEYLPNEEVAFTYHQKQDEDLDGGEIRVRIVWADGVEGNAEVVGAVEGAVERWREIWGSMGVRLVESYHTSTLDPGLGFTYTGDAEVADAAVNGEMMLIIGEQILDETDTFGISGGIPGTIAVSPNTFVVVSWLVHAGVDGAFSAGEVTTMGETMAHECGHYMGLFHPVEWNYDAWDAIADTPNCDRRNSCENDLGDNLMFPYPVCDYDYENCVPQGTLTVGQSAVQQRYTGTL